MGRVVAKFGGTSVGSAERIRHAAAIIAETHAQGAAVAVVVSAMAGETDRLLGLANSLGGGLGDAETDVALAAGEQVSAALMALALRERGLEARSYLGWQLPVVADGPAGAAQIAAVEADRIEAALECGVIPVVAGYQGIDADGCVRTLGRGGTDLSAVALAAAIGARCDIYTDVDGVYTTDPRIEPDARRLAKLSHDETLELAAQGAKVLQARSVEMAKAHAVPLRVLSSLVEPGAAEGTWIVPDHAIKERQVVSGIAYVRDQARIRLQFDADSQALTAEVFERLSEAGTGVDMIVQLPAARDNRVTLEFSIAHRDLDLARKVLEQFGSQLQIEVESGLAKVSVVGAGLRQRADIAHSLFGVLGRDGIGIRVVSTSEIKISALIENDAVERAVRALHAAYGLDRME